MLRLFNNSDIFSIVSIWNDACGPDLAITPRFVEYNTRPATGVIQSGYIALQDGQPVGFVLASTLPNNPTVSPPQLGWIDALAVLPSAQKQNIGSELLAAAEDWLRAQGCSRFRLGGSLKPFIPGLPVELNDEDFFRKRGYGGDKVDWDFASDLGNYVRRTHPERSEAKSQDESHVTIRPAQPGDESTILEFFKREFPGRWQFEFQEFLNEQGRITDYHLLITNRVDGFARLTFEDSERPIERFYMQRLPKPWGQLGPIGVSKDTRGKGFGGALLDAALYRLHEQGIRGCVIDWTSLAEFYGKFGFKPYRKYLMLIKS
ncbi:MAG: GNAT family N-acetyltransferase [Chloroflexi bacterium]|nr:GNAT family N-acetyltransferase [Chloroflexota bacterium]